MKHQSTQSNILRLCLCLSLGFAFSTSNAQLTYTQVTNGLSSISFEGGEAEFELGDMDGDGDLDIVSIGDHGNPQSSTQKGIMVWFNNGTGTSWTSVKGGNFGYGGVALGDVNGDGIMDVGFGQHHNNPTSGLGSQYMEVALGNGTGTGWVQYSSGLGDTAVTGMNWGMFGSDFGDINNDGKLDMVSVSFGCCDGLWMFKNNGNGTWTKTDGGGVGNVLNSSYCMMGDFNNDGNVDVAVSTQAGSVYKNDGTGNFSGMMTGLPNDWTMKFDIADVNNDGAKDIVIATPGSGGGGGVTVYTYNKTTSTWVAVSSGLPTTAIIGVALDDMDMDGKADLLCWNTTGITIYKGDGTGTNWTANGTIAVASASTAGFRFAVTGDLDHDGFKDIVYFGNNGGNNTLKVFLHTVNNPSLGILADFPKGKECFAPGSVQFVKWQSSVPSGPLATVNIELSTSGANGPWTPVATGVPNSGNYQWVLPNVTSNNCYLKFTVNHSSGTQTTMTNAFGIGDCSTPPPTGIQDQTWSPLQFNLYPNPAGSTTTITLTSLAGDQAPVLMIYDVTGNEVFSQVLQASTENLQFDLPSGVYTCEVRQAEVRFTQKLVVLK